MKCLKILESILLISFLACACYVVLTLAKEISDTLSATRGAVTLISGQLVSTSGAIQNQVALARAESNQQLTALNGTLSQATSKLLTQTDSVALDLHSVTESLNKGPIAAATTLIANPDIPKLLRDTRETVAITGVTMSHIRATANTVNEATPAIVASIDKVSHSAATTAASVDSVAASGKKFVDKLLAPQTKWQKVKGFIENIILPAAAKGLL